MKEKFSFLASFFFLFNFIFSFKKVLKNTLIQGINLQKKNKKKQKFYEDLETASTVGSSNFFQKRSLEGEKSMKRRNFIAY